MSSPTEPPGADAPGPTRSAAARRCLPRERCTGRPSCLPISSSGHVAVVPWLLRWDYAEIDPELRKAFEVALHAGTAAALLITLRREVEEARPAHQPAPDLVHRRSRSPPGDRRLHAGAIRSSATSARRPRSPSGSSAARSRWRGRIARPRRAAPHRTPAPADALALGIAQACALIPGVSRNGATLAAARLRGSRARTPTSCRGTWRCRSSPGPRCSRPSGWPAGGSRRGARLPFAVGAGRIVRLDPGLHLADPPGRARPLAAPVRRLPPGAGGARPAAPDAARPPTVRSRAAS